MSKVAVVLAGPVMEPALGDNSSRSKELFVRKVKQMGSGFKPDSILFPRDLPLYQTH